MAEIWYRVPIEHKPPLYQRIKNKTAFSWTKEVEQIFKASLPYVGDNTTYVLL
jgi:hypothetical protein